MAPSFLEARPRCYSVVLSRSRRQWMRCTWTHHPVRRPLPVACAITPSASAPLAAYTVWLDPALRDVERVQALLTPYSAGAMVAYPVSTLVNSPANDAPECIAPLAWYASTQRSSEQHEGHA